PALTAPRFPYTTLFRSMDGADIEPVVTWGITPAQSISVGAQVPAAEDFSADERETVEEAFRYMSLKPGQPIKGTKVDVAFIGSRSEEHTSELQSRENLV